jgi:hypothetical protein
MGSSNDSNFDKNKFNKNLSKINQDIQREMTGKVSTEYQPSLKFEMYMPQEKQQTIMGSYPQYTLNNISPSGIPGMNKNLTHLFAPSSAISYGPNVQLPMQKVYNINLPGPTGGHVAMKRIYENVLPNKEGKFTSSTIGERTQMEDYVKQILIQVHDGENISLDADGHRSLMSYIKFMEINPNYYSPLSNNPYDGLPYGLLVYRSCFPIKFDEVSRSIVCAKDSIGLNIRLYCLTFAEYFSYYFRQPIYKNYDVWRELMYYEYIRENIIHKKQSPNFALLYAFFLSPNKKIDFFSLKKNGLSQKDMLTKEYLRFKYFYETNTLDIDVIKKMPILSTVNSIAKLPDEVDPTLQLYSGTTLILITEAPHHNLYQWASKEYDKDGILEKMVKHGFHTEKDWFGIIFQIISALYVMSLHNIYIRDMTIRDNIYIKDLQIYGSAAGYWKYIINGIQYYVPNYGYLVMIDSNFKDINPESVTLDKNKREYKIKSTNIYTQDRDDAKDIKDKIFENYRRIINTNNFTKEHMRNGVTRPPSSVMTLISDMMKDDEINSSKDIGKVISKYFRRFLNNRVGTLARKDTELPNIRDTTGNFSKGEMALEIIEEDVYKWCQVIETRSDGMVDIVTKEKTDSMVFENKTVHVSKLKKYSQTEKIEQISTDDVNFAEDQLLETYIIAE